ncbi:MAG: HAD-IIB family hydrolase [Proteobacteria bacterium]|nr:HAD-IIB family hydrolase [Pseudomonadota bacterium]
MNNIQSMVKNFSAKWLVFTDLDGTLLDRRYDLEAAATAMDDLHDLGCICIPASSKTYDEMVALNKYRKFPSPCIFENGAGLFWPSSAEPESLGRCANEIHDLLEHIRDEHSFAFRTIRDIGCDELREITGLDHSGAVAAKARTGSMPLLWQDSEQAQDTFHEILGFIGLQIVRGGLFQTVLDKSCSKAVGMKTIAEHFNRGENRPALVACGDAENDLDMLLSADFAVLFPDSNGQYLSLDHKFLHRAKASGHEAWLQALQQVLIHNEPKGESPMPRTETQSFE